MAERQQQQIARINELSALARTSWLVLLAYLSYTGITLLSVEDADFFVPSRQTELPLVGVSIPTYSFFFFAPPLGAALYIYLLIYLLKLFDALATAPASIDGQELGSHIHPWLANDLFLAMRKDKSASSRPLSVLSNVASFMLIWVAAPLVLAGFWWRSMPAHEEWLTLFLALSWLVTIYAGVSSWWGARHAAKRVFRRPWPKPWPCWWRCSFSLLAALVIGLSAWRTEWSVEYDVNRFIDWSEKTLDRKLFEGGRGKTDQRVQAEWVASRFGLAKTDLSGVMMVPLPESWRSREAARTDYRERWCQLQGLSMEVCGHLPSYQRAAPVALRAEREKWCVRLFDVLADNCLTQFDDLNERFAEDWKRERSAMLSGLTKLDLAWRDLRGVQAVGVSLVNADLWAARLEGANLRRALLEGADLSYADLDEANLRYARMEGADLSYAYLEEADLQYAHLEGAQLSSAYLEGADLQNAHLEGADLSNTYLKGADLQYAHLEGADLSNNDHLAGVDLDYAHLEAANLFDVNLEGANLERAHLEKAELRLADLEKAVLSRAHLEEADLRKANLKEANLLYAHLEGADLSDAHLERAHLWGVYLEGADLSRAHLEGADLIHAHLEGADLKQANLQEADLFAANLNRALLHDADLRGVPRLLQSQLDNAIGNSGTLLPDGLDPNTGEPYYIWSCSKKSPLQSEEFLPWKSYNPSTVWGRVVCLGRPGVRSGIRLNLDAPYPEGHPLADNN